MKKLHMQILKKSRRMFRKPQKWTRLEKRIRKRKERTRGKKKKSIVKNYRILIICVRHFIRWIIRQRSIGIS